MVTPCTTFHLNATRNPCDTECMFKIWTHNSIFLFCFSFICLFVFIFYLFIYFWIFSIGRAETTKTRWLEKMKVSNINLVAGWKFIFFVGSFVDNRNSSGVTPTKQWPLTGLPKCNIRWLCQVNSVIRMKVQTLVQTVSNFVFFSNLDTPYQWAFAYKSCK